MGRKAYCAADDSPTLLLILLVGSAKAIFKPHRCHSFIGISLARFVILTSFPAGPSVTQFDEELAVLDFSADAGRLNHETLAAGLHNCSDNECKNAKGDPGALAAPRWLTY
jgi:hypothetical protein